MRRSATKETFRQTDERCRRASGYFTFGRRGSSDILYVQKWRAIFSAKPCFHLSIFLPPEMVPDPDAATDCRRPETENVMPTYPDYQALVR